MRKAAIAALAFLFILSLSATALADSKVGFVDFDKILELTAKGKDTRKKLAALKDELEIKIQEQELELRKMNEELKTKKDVMSKEAFEQKLQEFQQKYLEFQRNAQESTSKFEQFRVKQIRTFVSDIQVVVDEVAKAEGYAMVIMKFEDFITNSSIVLYGDSSVDLTDKVIKRLNEAQ